jgi:hypothetical protein
VRGWAGCRCGLHGRGRGGLRLEVAQCGEPHQPGWLVRLSFWGRADRGDAYKAANGKNRGRNRFELMKKGWVKVM